MSEVVKLIREPSSDQGTFGRLVYGGKTIAFTCELPWNDNTPRKSCIPAGRYECVPYSSEKYKDVWEITNVPARSKILIHNGNTIRDIEGCILVGRYYDVLNGLRCVTHSRATLEKLRGILPDFFTIDIGG